MKYFKLNNLPPLLRSQFSMVCYFENEKGTSFKTTPNNTFDILINLNGSVSLIHEHSHTHLEKNGIMGMNTEHRTIELKDLTKGFHLRLEPQRIANFTRVPVSEITKQALTLHDLFKFNIDGQIEETKEVSKQLEIIEKSFVNIFEEVDTRKVEYLINTIKASNGSLSKQQLAALINSSEKTVERLFNNRVGISVKNFSKIVRFQNAIELFESIKNKEATNLLDIAIDSGYYDQSHFIRDCKALTGKTPSEYFNIENLNVSGLYNY